MNLLNEELARARIRESEDFLASRSPEIADAIRLFRAQRKARRWSRLSRWAARRAERALNP